MAKKFLIFVMAIIFSLIISRVAIQIWGVGPRSWIPDFLAGMILVIAGIVCIMVDLSNLAKYIFLFAVLCFFFAYHDYLWFCCINWKGFS